MLEGRIYTDFYAVLIVKVIRLDLRGRVVSIAYYKYYTFNKLEGRKPSVLFASGIARHGDFYEVYNIWMWEDW